MANNIAFQPMGPTVKIFAATANTQGNVVSITAFSPVNQYLVTNHTSNASAIVRIEKTNDFNVAIPGEAGAEGFCVAPYSHVVITGPQTGQTSNSFARVISNQAGLIVTIVPGEGL